MGLFAKKNGAASACGCGGNCGGEAAERTETAKSEKTGGNSGVKVLGSGCAKCNALEKAVGEALAELGMNTDIDHVTDFAQIAAYGVMTTPALVVDGRVVSYGRVLKKGEALAVLRKARAL